MDEPKKHNQSTNTSTSGIDKQGAVSAKKPRRRSTKSSASATTGADAAAASTEGQQTGAKSSRLKKPAASAEEDRRANSGAPPATRGKGKARQNEPAGVSPPASLAKRKPRGMSAATGPASTTKQPITASVSSASASSAKDKGLGNTRPVESEKTVVKDHGAGSRKKADKPKSSPRPEAAGAGASSAGGAATPTGSRKGQRGGKTPSGGSRAQSPTSQLKARQAAATQAQTSPQKPPRGERRRETVQKAQKQKAKANNNSSGQQIPAPKDDSVAKRKQAAKRTSQAKQAKEKTSQLLDEVPKTGANAGSADAGHRRAVSDRLSTKVCIRWLPADLPEHVFWRSVEPALPWFDPETPGSVVTKQREVLCLPSEEEEQQTAEPQDDGEQEPNKAEAGSSGSEASAPPQPKVRSAKAPTKMADADVFTGPAIDRLDEYPYWRSFARGKTHRTRAKPADPARAYILFSTQAEVDHFYRRYHGHAFAKNGVVCRAVVELAAFQHVAFGEDADSIEGTIDDDADFQAFLNPHLAQNKAKPLARVSYAAAAAAKPAAVALLENKQLVGSGAGANGAPGSTPLIEYLRAIKSKSLGKAGKAAAPKNSALAKSAAGSGGKSAASTSAAAVAAASAASKSQEDAGSKRRRRRNR